MRRFFKNKAIIRVVIQDDNVARYSIEFQRESNLDSEEAKLARAIQSINFAIEIGVTNIILEGDSTNVIDTLQSKEEENSWLGAMVEISS